MKKKRLSWFFPNTVCVVSSNMRIIGFRVAAAGTVDQIIRDVFETRSHRWAARPGVPLFSHIFPFNNTRVNTTRAPCTQNRIQRNNIMILLCFLVVVNVVTCLCVIIYDITRNLCYLYDVLKCCLV